MNGVYNQEFMNGLFIGSLAQQLNDLLKECKLLFLNPTGLWPLEKATSQFLWSLVHSGRSDAQLNMSTSQRTDIRAAHLPPVTLPFVISVKYFTLS